MIIKEEDNNKIIQLIEIQHQMPEPIEKQNTQFLKKIHPEMVQMSPGVESKFTFTNFISILVTVQKKQLHVVEIKKSLALPYGVKT